MEVQDSVEARRTLDCQRLESSLQPVSRGRGASTQLCIHHNKKLRVLHRGCLSVQGAFGTFLRTRGQVLQCCLPVTSVLGV